MEFDQDNPVVHLCARGMEKEGTGSPGEAKQLFNEAWNAARTDMEKFTAAHYVARQQETVKDKLHWDTLALGYALKIKEEPVKGTLPSLYLNVGKCYEDLGDFASAKINYEYACSFARFLTEDGYGNMIRSGINKALERV